MRMLARIANHTGLTPSDIKPPSNSRLQRTRPAGHYLASAILFVCGSRR
jgi:hypothetical protein